MSNETTWSEACELIASYWKEIGRKLNKFPDRENTADDIFHYSSTGELYLIPIWLDEAKAYFAMKPFKQLPDGPQLNPEAIKELDES